MSEGATPRNELNGASDANREPIQLFAEQKKIITKSVKGKYRTLKWVAMVFTLSIYYLAPFIRWDRGANAPDQAILIDLPNRKAYWFWIEIWPQEVYILTGILILAAIALFFVTSLFGRVWCGYFCPQTVWTDLYMYVEKIVQGDRNARVKIREGPWNFNKIWRIALTHTLWVAIAWATAGSFTLYFNDAPTLVHSFFNLDVSNTVLAFIVGLTASTYLMAGFAREQVCTHMCPYARFQSAMFDENTLIIGYDTQRGETRGKHKKGDTWDGRGHCIDCTACVQVCPMGIDIRNGLQMECIACGLCIDACNDIMDKIDLPRGLIRYDTDHRMAQKTRGITEGFNILRPRTIYYAAVMCVVGCIMLYALLTKNPVELHVLHDRNPMFVALSSGEIRNGYEIKILNKTNDPQSYKLEISGLKDYTVDVKSAGDISIANLPVAAGAVGHYHIFVRSPVEPQTNIPLNFQITDIHNESTSAAESIFITQGAGE